MKRMLCSFLAVLAFSGLQLQARKVVDVAEYAGKDCQDYTPVVLSILAENPDGGLTLNFGEGDFHFYPTYARAKYHCVTNHDNSYKYFAFPFENMKDVVVDGKGADFIFHGVITPFLVEGSENIVLKNFSIDWEEPFYVQAHVLEADQKAKSVKVRFTDFSKYQIDGTVFTLTNNGQQMNFLGECMVFDPETMAVAYNAAKYLIGGPRTKAISVRNAKDGICNISAPFMKAPAPVGTAYIFKGPNSENRMAPAIHVISSAGFEASDINIHHAGGMGIIAEKSKDLHLDHVNVCLREGTDRLVTTTADATHFCNCGGFLIVENCLFENMLDDATNVHGTYMKVVKVIGPQAVLAKLNHPQQFDYDFAAAGDKIQIVADKTILPKKTVKVVSCKKINEIYAVVRFDSPVDDIVAPGDGLENMTWYPELIFRNNVIRNNRARSILISSPKKVLIENNTFSSMMTGILFEGDLEHWHESGAVNDVIIRNNTFYDCCYGGNKASCIWINPHLVEMPENQYYERNIIIEGNLFNTFDRSILSAKSVDGLFFRANEIRPSGTYAPLHPEMPELNLIHCNGFVFEKNTFNKKGEEGQVVMDEYSRTRKAVVKGNKHFTIE